LKCRDAWTPSAASTCNAFVVHCDRNAVSLSFGSPLVSESKFHSVIQTGSWVPMVLLISDRAAPRWLVQLSMWDRQ
jgi:hypothetical protein